VPSGKWFFARRHLQEQWQQRRLALGGTRPLPGGLEA